MSTSLPWKAIAVMTSGEDMKGTIAAIDFGTMSCSVAYCTENDQAIQNLEINPASSRVPTALLLKKKGDNKYAVEYFGDIAQEAVLAFGHDELISHSYMYFEFFKMQIHQKVSREKGGWERIKHNWGEPDITTASAYGIMVSMLSIYVSFTCISHTLVSEIHVRPEMLRVFQYN